jgi:hypothetical protein
MEGKKKIMLGRVALIAPIVLLEIQKITYGFLRRKMIPINWVGDILLAAGWVMGYFLADMDHLFYATVCNPQELTCQRVRHELDNKNWRNAWGLLEATKDERVRMPIRNILTAVVVAGLGLWVVSSSGSWIAMGMVLSLNTRLFTELVTTTDRKKWYWVFARDFSDAEHRGFLIAWGLALGIMYLIALGR